VPGCAELTDSTAWRSFRGRRLFVLTNKTCAGAVVSIGTTTLAAGRSRTLSPAAVHLRRSAPFAETHPLAWGLLIRSAG